MNMKKIFGLLFIPALAIGIAGCGKDKKKEPQKEEKKAALCNTILLWLY